MNSSTSSSEPQRRRAWIAHLLGTFFGGVLLLYALLLLIDPYDSARFPTLGLVGVTDPNLRTADVSRGRDSQFDAAIFGSSTGQSLDPHRLSAATGLRFVQLAITQAGPREVLALLGWFTARHARVGAVIVAADIEWCSADLSLGVRYPFPFWLYGNDWDYLANVLNWKSFDRAAWRIQLALGKRRPNDQVGYYPYAPPYGDVGFEPKPPTQPDLGLVGTGFPWIDQLARALQRLPPPTAIIILMPPVAQSYLPPAGSPASSRIAACKSALAQLVAARPQSGFIDDRDDSALAQDEANFYDRVHFRPPVARAIQAQLIALLTGKGQTQPIAMRSPAAQDTP